MHQLTHSLARTHTHTYRVRDGFVNALHIRHGRSVAQTFNILYICLEPYSNSSNETVSSFRLRFRSFSSQYNSFFSLSLSHTQFQFAFIIGISFFCGNWWQSTQMLELKAKWKSEQFCCTNLMQSNDWEKWKNHSEKIRNIIEK